MKLANMNKKILLVRMESGFELMLPHDPWGRPLPWAILRDRVGGSPDEQVPWWQVERLLENGNVTFEGEVRDGLRLLVLTRTTA